MTSTASDRPIRVGVVGLSASGWASMALAPALQHPSLASKYLLTAVSTTSDTSASVSAKTYSTETNSVKPFSGDTAHIANDPDVDLVMISVRAPGHKRAALPVISAKKSLFIEWPAGLNLRETTEIAEAAKMQGIRTMVGLQGRYTPVVCKIKEYVDGGKIGKVLSSSVIAMAPREYGFWGPRVNERNDHTINKDDGATMLDVALGHELDILTHILGDFASVSATSTIIYPSATILSSVPDQTRTASVTAADHVAFSGLLKSGSVFLWLIDGEEGSIRVEEDAVGGAFIQISDPKLFLNGERVPTDENWGGFVGSVRAQLAEFANGGKDTKYATMEDAVKLRMLLKAIDDSARDGERVFLN
ncbi:NAD-binding Rossmann fold oxidoreductase [Mycena venus]|uniref:NAD-binding Rossmann fold oxidoreductase n=1 Tax=Mycena venus TaxID=2733690 RepID=A0A8H6WYM4_9AGAR|nr:NAD-binding Rossmann fold oxidoreductase [Mycena venus]